jgi:hypothetical protein
MAKIIPSEAAPLEERIKHDLKKRLPATYWNAQKADEITTRLANGESLIPVLKELKIHPMTFYKWLSVKEFRDVYTDARKIQAELMVNDILRIADDAINDRITLDDGKVVMDFARIQRARLMIDSRKWIASKLLPKVYGDRLALTDAEGQNLKLELPWVNARSIGKRGDVQIASDHVEPIDITPIDSKG